MIKKIILKSIKPDKYPNLIIQCKVIENDKIGEYLSNIPDSKKFVAFKNGEVEGRKGIVGEEIESILTTIIDGKEYILHEEKNIVKERQTEKNGIQPDIVVTNINSTSNEQYIVKYDKFISTYTTTTKDGKTACVPNYEPRVLTQIDENVIIMTEWGAEAVCLKGGYIVTYNASNNDYNTLEKGAFESTYTVVSNTKHNANIKK